MDLTEPEFSPDKETCGDVNAFPIGHDRYHRDPIGSDGSVLGEEQWAWLEEEMELDGGNGDVPPPALIIIASSIQVIPNYTIYVQPFATVESWNLFPSEQSRLFDLVKRASSRKPSPYRVVFLSGDVHLVI